MNRRTKGSKRGMTVASYRAAKDLYSGGIRKEISETPVCPYCGGKMILKSGSEIGSYYADQMRYVCENYPECETSARAEYYKGRWQMISTPANKSLRILRNEAHFWIEKLVETGLIGGTTTAYSFVSNKSIIANGRLIHIGQCREAACKDIIKTCVEYLYENRKKFDRFPGFYSSTTRHNKELWEKVKQISYKPESKYAVGVKS